MAQIFMESERLVFRGVEIEDAPVLRDWVNHPEIRRHLDHRVFPVGLEAEKAWAKRFAEAEGSSRSEIVFLVSVKAGGPAIGCSGFHAIHPLARSAEWGILLQPEQWNRGYGREIARRMLEYGFADLNLNAVRLRVSARHPSARKAYEAAGFVEEGVLREAGYSGGEYYDQVVMSVLRREWAAKKAAPPPE